MLAIWENCFHGLGINWCEFTLKSHDFDDTLTFQQYHKFVVTVAHICREESGFSDTNH